jgi:hypothetical protein
MVNCDLMEGLNYLAMFSSELSWSKDLEVGAYWDLMLRDVDFLIELLVLILENERVWKARRDNYY